MRVLTKLVVLDRIFWLISAFFSFSEMGLSYPTCMKAFFTKNEKKPFFGLTENRRDNTIVAHFEGLACISS